MMRRHRHVWIKVETCGDCRKVMKSVLFFIYTPVISISLASKPNTQNRPILLAIIILPPTVAHSAPYLLLFRLQIRTGEHRSSGLQCMASRKW